MKREGLKLRLLGWIYVNMLYPLLIPPAKKLSDERLEYSFQFTAYHMNETEANDLVDAIYDWLVERGMTGSIGFAPYVDEEDE